ncbi:MBL fold metallo-hydrolase [Spiroplasma endosymbiont of Labia minor]|uniref:MBL fold metallo-hydrolase n=1 Tax=Spiroplasma endosymbiont of Labia minor TaxID=3066305 RepID=UPI0030D1A71C
MIKVFKNIINNNKDYNSYLVYNENNEAILIDDSMIADEIIDWCTKNNIIITDILITHNHFDHIYELEKFVKKYNSIIHINFNDVEGLFDANINLSAIRNEINNWQLNREYIGNVKSFMFKNEMKINNFDIVICPMGGHTPGTTFYFFKNEKMIFVGDTLFRNGYGYRENIPRVNTESFDKSIEFIYANFDNTVKIYPGHNESGFTLEQAQDNLKAKALFEK